MSVWDQSDLILPYLDVRGLAMSAMVCKGWNEQAQWLSEQPFFTTAISENIDFEQALDEVVRACSSRCFQPNVGYLFLSDHYLRDNSGGDQDEKLLGPAGKIEAAIKGLLPPGITIIGCTGRGVIGHSATKGPCEIEPSDEEDEEDEDVSDLAVSLALAHVAGAKVRATMGNPSDFLAGDGDGSDALYPATDFHGDSNASGEYSVRAVCLADVKQRKTQAALQSFLAGFSSRYLHSEMCGGLASSVDPRFSRVFMRRQDSEGATTSCFGAGVAVVCTLVSAERAASGRAHPLTHTSVARPMQAVGPLFTIGSSTGLTLERIVTVAEWPDAPDVSQENEAGGKIPAMAAYIALANTVPGFAETCQAVGVSTSKDPNSSELRVLYIRGQVGDGGLKLMTGYGEEEGGEVIKPGMAMRFMIESDVNDSKLIEDDTRQQLAWTKERLSRMEGFGNHVVSNGSAPCRTKVRGGLLFACSGRGKGMYGRSNVDSKAFCDAFPTSEGLSGFFCNGEIGPAHLGSDMTQIHGFTSVYTLYEGV